jgi:hypothetical protein
MEQAEWHKWRNNRGPSNESRVGRMFILTMSEGGAVSRKYATTYRIAESGKLEVVPFPTVTKKIDSERSGE